MGSFGRSAFFVRISRTIFTVLAFSSLTSLEARASLEHASISMYAVHIPSGKVLIDENGDKSMTPSSCMKLVTAAAALHILGPQMRFSTHVAYDGKIENGTLQGNLYIIGGGDPCLGSDRIASSLSWDKLLNVWSLAVKNLGIEHIQGTIIADSSLWEHARAVPDWSWEDIGNYYGAGASALSFHENAYRVFFAPGSHVGDPASIIKMEPSLSHLALQSEVKTGEKGSGDQACIYGSEGTFVQKIRGTIPAGVLEFSIKGALPDPGYACIELFKRSLLSQGITLEGKELQEESRQVFYSIKSPTLSEIISAMQKKSINLYAEHLLKKMGEVELKNGSTLSGTACVKKFLQNLGLDLSGCRIADGSGLSRKNMITAHQLVELLILMKKSDFFPEFFNSLTVPRTGVHGKSGSMTLVRSYAGYCKDIAFAILINQCTDPRQAEEKIEDFMSFLANYSFPSS